MLKNKQLVMTSRCDSARFGRGQLFSLVVLTWAFSAGSAAVARDDAEEDEADAIAAERQVVLSEQQFDEMVFGASSAHRIIVENGVQRVAVPIPNTEESARKRLESALQAEMQTIHDKCSLTEAQKKKLRLAGRGDIADFCGRVSELRTKLTSKPLSRQQYVELTRELQPLRMATQLGTFGEGSLFQKTLRRALTDEQHARYRVLERERKVRMVESVVSNWDRNANGVKLLINNRHRFVEVLVEHGRHLPQGQNPYLHYIVLLEAVRLEERLKPLLTEENWKKLQTQAAQAKQIEATLRNSGQWPVVPEDDEEPSDKTKE
jgi:hypothetical protein